MARFRVAASALLTAVLALPLSAFGAPAATLLPDCGNRSGRVLLSIDDYPYGDPSLLTTLGAWGRLHHVRFAIFLLKKPVASDPAVIATLRRQGHWVFNHTWSHPDLTTLAPRQIRNQITGGVRSNLLRPPGGSYNPTVLAVAASLGYHVCTWTADTDDWRPADGQLPSVAALRSRVMAATNKAVVLGHWFTNYPAAIPYIVADLRSHGYRLCRDYGPTRQFPLQPLRC